MALKKSEFLGAWGKAFQIFKAIVDAILASGGSDEDVARLEILASQIAALSIAARPSKPETEIVEEQPAPKPNEKVEDLGWVVLDPAVPFEERKRLGNYKGGVHQNITADKSQLKRKVRRHIVLYDPQGSVSTEDMKRRIRANGDRPCDLDDGLGIGQTFPPRQVANPLPLLDESAVCADAHGCQCAPVLSYWFGKRKLRLELLAGGWFDCCRFPAVREEEFLDT
jgi:hypothetical protein